MTSALRAFGLAAGIAILVTTLSSVFTTLVVPRVSSARMLRALTGASAKLSRWTLRAVSGYNAKDRILALVGPLGIVTLFAAWLCFVVAGFGLVTWWESGTSLAHSLAVAGSSASTLGVLTVRDGGAETVEFVTAGVGLLVVALEIAYLPTLYAVFSAREAEVSLLATRAGVPAWGPELLARAHRFSLMGELPDLYRTWERWASAVAESHTNYPSLMWLRSPEPWRSWLTALAATLDAAALQDALTPGTSPVQARLCLQVGTHCLQSLAGAMRIGFDADPLPTDRVRLTEAEFRQGIDRLAQAGFPFERSPEEAWRHFRGWRVNYESIVDALTDRLVPPPAPWFLNRPWLGALRVPFVLNRTPDDPEASARRT